MKTYARLKNFGVPSLKVRRFASTIKGEPVDRSLAILQLQSSPTCQTLRNGPIWSGSPWIRICTRANM